MDAAIARCTRHIVVGMALALLTSTATPLIGGHDAAAKRSTARHSVSREGKAKAAKTITRTFTQRGDQSGEITIPDSNVAPAPADPYPSEITVSGFRQGRIVDVDLTLRGFSHEIPRDVDILLV